MNALELHGLEKHYPDFALGPIDLELPGGGAVMDELQQNGTGSGSLPVPLWLAAVLLLAVLALYAVSWRVSVAWYGKYKK